MVVKIFTAAGWVQAEQLELNFRGGGVSLWKKQ